MCPYPTSSLRGYIISHSKTWAPKGFSFLQKLGEKVKGMNSAIGKPLEAISRNSDLGRCWAMDGSVGYVTSIPSSQYKFMLGLSKRVVLQQGVFTIP